MAIVNIDTNELELHTALDIYKAIAKDICGQTYSGLLGVESADDSDDFLLENASRGTINEYVKKVAIILLTQAQSGVD